MFRIGVHLGEVIVDEDNHDLFGDGVNLTERIQSMAEPGGIAVSRAVRDVTELQVDYAFVDGGEHRAKNVSRPLHIYHVRARAGASRRTTTSVVPRATLRFHGTDLAGRKFGFDLSLDRLVERAAEGFVIGRDFDHCDAVLSHPTVSRRHARLILVDNTLQIEDLGSTNGTAVDGLAGGRRCAAAASGRRQAADRRYRACRSPRLDGPGRYPERGPPSPLKSRYGPEGPRFQGGSIFKGLPRLSAIQSRFMDWAFRPAVR